MLKPTLDLYRGDLTHLDSYLINNGPDVPPTSKVVDGLKDLIQNHDYILLLGKALIGYEKDRFVVDGRSQLLSILSSRL